MEVQPSLPVPLSVAYFDHVSTMYIPLSVAYSDHVATITLLPNVNIHIIYTCLYNISFYRVPISPFVFVEISIIFTPTSNQSPRNRPSAGCGCGRRWQAQVISLLRWWWACGSCWDPMALLVWAQAGDRKGEKVVPADGHFGRYPRVEAIINPMNMFLQDKKRNIKQKHDQLSLKPAKTTQKKP